MSEILLSDDHKYTVDGKYVAGYSEIAQATGLVRSMNYDEFYGQRGTAVHTMCDLIDEDNLDDSSIDGSNGMLNLKPYADAYREFIADRNPDFTIKETMLYHPTYRYCGTLDRAFPLIDIKSGVEVKTFQLEAYGELLRANGYKVGTHAHYLYLTDKGKYKFKSYKFNRQLRGIWLSAVSLFNYRKENNLL